MAEVLPPPMQSPTIAMLHSRPSSADALQGSQQYHRLSQGPRSMYNGQNASYRGVPAPVQPYAFQSTPHLRQDSRTSSAPAAANGHLIHHKQTASASTTSSDTSSLPSAKDDAVSAARSASMVDFAPQLPDLSFASFDKSVKSSPGRYRRPGQQRVDSGSSNSIPRPALYSTDSENVPPGGIVQPVRQLQRQSSYDDIAIQKPNQSELAKRYRRRSLNQLETAALTNPPGGADQLRSASAHGSRATSTPTTIRPSSFVSVDGESQLSNGGSIAKVDSAKDPENKTTVTATTSNDQRMNVPPRGASSDGVKRLAAPSPLSRQASETDSPPGSAGASPTKPQAGTAATFSTPSAAAQQLAAVSDKDLNKGTKSRLRRAFSFSSGKELRRAAGENSQQQAARQNDENQQQQQQPQAEDEMDDEQLEIARRQEAAGIGAGIYSGQGGFAGSTDNLSISSTASSASMMLRKMGRGAKKGARSIKGLFRPKSVIGVPAADGPIQMPSTAPVEPSIGQVSMVTVEGERHNVNVNAHPEERTGGGTGFPKLQKNSLDAPSEAMVSVDGSDSTSRRSIVGSDKDRAEVLAAVRKGILKRSATGSPVASPRVRPSDAGVQMVESPALSIPSTPRDVHQLRSSSAPSVNMNGDYFSAARVMVTKSIPNTPNGSIRSISFSPRIQFHDAWSATEYDRRGEIATCNRLTPLLAQQIKEELNTFKMEMEVHEQSKPHTHFF